MREFRVTDLNVDRRPDPQAFTKVAPGRMQLHGGSRLPGIITLDAGTRVSPGNLRELYAALKRRAEGEGGEVAPGEVGWRRWATQVAPLARRAGRWAIGAPEEPISKPR